MLTVNVVEYDMYTRWGIGIAFEGPDGWVRLGEGFPKDATPQEAAEQLRKLADQLDEIGGKE